ncbi:hypothetical protein P3X46_021857 [Hevea brasiliensis]|uniref:CR-type domain-containing protein n=2 Tax=Hevea brasiliensis TaxID=3981 RepID=A0ABQ9LGW0_HEVBR|nr:hypothetical protein P3X46_021857 [Hevea brasiliensis]
MGSLKAAAAAASPLLLHPQLSVAVGKSKSVDATPRIVSVSASKSAGFSINSILNGCKTCGGKGAIECPGCKGTGKNKKNGNIFERWKCFDCQGFGLKSCPNCGKGGLTPEQRGER